MSMEREGDRALRRSLLIGAIIALTSQLYLNVFIDDFRISAAVVLLPVFLMTVGMRFSVVPICFWTAGIVFLFRFLILWAHSRALPGAALSVLPGAVFYLIYGLMFHRLLRNRRIAGLPEITLTVFCCDFGANLTELLIRGVLFGTERPAAPAFRLLLAVALIRTSLVLGALLLDRYYRTYRLRHERERRYRRLFLMITGLKSELYLMRKNSDEIERVMRNAYELSRAAEGSGLPEEMKRMAFDIARDVHEIKKDYFRIIQGIEETVDHEYDEDRLRFQELMDILRSTAFSLMREKGLDVRLEIDCGDDFVTREHYMLMQLLKNLLSNALESIEGGRKRGTVRIRERKLEDSYVFEVEDDGPGIAAGSMEKIFRLGYSTKFDERTGNIYRGVGLAGVRDIAENYFGGGIEAESIPELRTRFTLHIPAGRLEMREGTEEIDKEQR